MAIRHLLLAALAGLAASVAPLRAEDDPPATVVPIRGAVGKATVRLEFLGRGLIPTARVVIINPGPERLHLSRSWTYQVVPQPALTDRGLVARLPTIDDARSFALSEVACAPEARVAITLSAHRLFGSDAETPIIVSAGRAWGHDHPLDLRVARLPAGIVFVRLVFTDEIRSDWLRYVLPDVPDAPLIRFGGEAHKLGEPQFERVAKPADAVFIATAASNGWPFTRVLTLAADDPLAKLFPRLLLDGKSLQVFADGLPCRFAVRGIRDGVVDDEAEVIAVQPLR